MVRVGKEALEPSAGYRLVRPADEQNAGVAENREIMKIKTQDAPPPVFCKKGHLIPDNEDRYNAGDSRSPTAKPGLVACRICAIEAGGVLFPRKRPAHGKELEALGQDASILNGPTIEIK